jgi:hypothetical protein
MKGFHGAAIEPAFSSSIVKERLDCTTVERIVEKGFGCEAA